VIAIVTTGRLTKSSPPAVAAPTWADMARQTAGIDRVHIDARMYAGSTIAQRAEIWIKAPGVIRTRGYGSWTQGRAELNARSPRRPGPPAGRTHETRRVHLRPPTAT